MVNRILIIVLLLLCFTAQASQKIAIPPELESWVPWVLEGSESINCPFEFKNGDSHQCVWPEPLILKLQSNGGSFSQRWQVYGESWVRLPGNKKHWPQALSVNGNP